MADQALTVYQENHLRVAFEHHAPMLYGPMVEASRAHVVMLAEQGLIPAERAATLLRGLEAMRSDDPAALTYDGSVEDVYFTMEKRLAAAAGIGTAELDVQLARSRNDLDQGIFRMILRGQLAAVLDEVLTTAGVLLDAADRYADVVVIGYTHRRPAQPTTVGHVLAGYAEALAGHARAYTALIDEVNVSPLGSCAFAGTDLDISPARVAELLGFDGLIVNSYEAVAGADYLVRVATLNAQVLATGARFVRTLMDWLSWQWLSTPPEFTQGSSIMPQKRNPVVFEHLVSMAGATAADAASVLNNVGAAWWEDSNNATTDVQARLWESNDRATRFFRLLGGLLARVEPLSPPAAAEIVATGATTTAATDTLTASGVPFRAAHSVVGRLLREGPPDQWTTATVLAVAAELGLSGVTEEAAKELIAAANDPARVLHRAQADGPGSAQVRRQVARLRESVAASAEHVSGFRLRLDAAAVRLDDVVRERIAA
ncbi:argininosuccinate lyase [Jiangella rhizosphaerae]|uniref:argininosuccinate lyase n=1 Tax=Jiangella rhizosphaerae TaxID=2293569 RepID=A0A418KMW0_9ACTN|nr:lyase family protein [Jiangella rhizosphaerae]RIQ20243.1 argininosuccinate lyase [Jiangella rhizosphaerae]